jgi:hypothetical protein
MYGFYKDDMFIKFIKEVNKQMVVYEKDFEYIQTFAEKRFGSIYFNLNNLKLIIDKLNKTYLSNIQLVNDEDILNLYEESELETKIPETIQILEKICEFIKYPNKPPPTLNSDIITNIYSIITTFIDFIFTNFQVLSSVHETNDRDAQIDFIDCDTHTFKHYFDNKITGNLTDEEIDQIRTTLFELAYGITNKIYNNITKLKPNNRIKSDLGLDFIDDDDEGYTPPAGEQPAGEQPAGEQPAVAPPAGEQPAGEQPAGEQPAVAPSTGTSSTGTSSTGTSSTGTSQTDISVGGVRVRRNDNYDYDEDDNYSDYSDDEDNEKPEDTYNKKLEIINNCIEKLKKIEAVNSTKEIVNHKKTDVLTIELKGYTTIFSILKFIEDNNSIEIPIIDLDVSEEGLSTDNSFDPTQFTRNSNIATGGMRQRVVSKKMVKVLKKYTKKRKVRQRYSRSKK